MNKPQLFLAGMVVGQVLSLVLIRVASSKWLADLRHRILLYRIKQAYKRIENTSDHITRLLNA